MKVMTNQHGRYIQDYLQTTIKQEQNQVGIEELHPVDLVLRTLTSYHSTRLKLTTKLMSIPEKGDQLWEIIMKFFFEGKSALAIK
jgi:hypothetical protein